MIWATVSSWSYLLTSSVFGCSFSIFGCKKYNQSDFNIDHLVVSMCRVFSYSWCKLYNGPQSFWHQGLVLWKTVFPWTREGGWIGDDLSALHLLGTLFLLPSHQFHLRSSGIRSSGTPGVKGLGRYNLRCWGHQREARFTKSWVLIKLMYSLLSTAIGGI